jgi:hypothetical protein
MDQIIAEARRREKTYREQALKMYHGYVRDAGANSQARDFVSSQSITRITTTITIRLTVATGNCCVSTVTTMSTRGIWMRNGMIKRCRETSKSHPLPPSTFKAFAGLEALLKNKK